MRTFTYSNCRRSFALTDVVRKINPQKRKINGQIDPHRKFTFDHDQSDSRKDYGAKKDVLNLSSSPLGNELVIETNK